MRAVGPVRAPSTLWSLRPSGRGLQDGGAGCQLRSQCILHTPVQRTALNQLQRPRERSDLTLKHALEYPIWQIAVSCELVPSRPQDILLSPHNRHGYLVVGNQ